MLSLQNYTNLKRIRVHHPWTSLCRKRQSICIPLTRTWQWLLRRAYSRAIIHHYIFGRSGRGLYKYKRISSCCFDNGYTERGLGLLNEKLLKESEMELSDEEEILIKSDSEKSMNLTSGSLNNNSVDVEGALFWIALMRINVTELFLYYSWNFSQLKIYFIKFFRKFFMKSWSHRIYQNHVRK